MGRAFSILTPPCLVVISSYMQKMLTKKKKELQEGGLEILHLKKGRFSVGTYNKLKQTYPLYLFGYVKDG